MALGFIGLALFTVGFTFGFGALVWVPVGMTAAPVLVLLCTSLATDGDVSWPSWVAVVALFRACGVAIGSGAGRWTAGRCSGHGTGVCWRLRTQAAKVSIWSTTSRPRRESR